MARQRERDEHWQTALAELRAICLALPGAAETFSFGNPAFKVGRKTFAVLDDYRGATCVWLACGPGRRADLLSEEGFFPSPYDRAGVALCRAAAGIDWPDFAKVVRESYERAL